MENWKETLRENLLPLLAAVVIGVLVGAVDALFGRVLLAIGDVRDAHFVPLVVGLPLAGAAIAWAYRRWGGPCGKGMGLVFAAGRGEEEAIPLKLIPLILGGTWLTHLTGGSAGREGVAVQIGATVGHGIGRRLDRGNHRVYLVTGMAAGFGGLFRTPLAAACFALEVGTAGALDLRALLPALVGSYTASAVSGALGLEKFTVELSPFTPDGKNWCALLLCGVLFGLVGGAFAKVLSWAKGALGQKIPQPVARAAGVGAVLAVLLFLLGQGRYAGLGTNLISLSTSGGEVFAWDWALKFLFTVTTLAAGFQGGEVTPLFSIGASLGAVAGPLLGLPVAWCAALGYAAVFGGATNTLLAPILIGCEVFGYGALPVFFPVCALAYVCSGGGSIYGAQRTLPEETFTGKHA